MGKFAVQKRMKMIKKEQSEEEDMNSVSSLFTLLLTVLDRIFFNRDAILRESTKLIVLFIHSPQFCNQTNKYLGRRWRRCASRREIEIGETRMRVEGESQTGACQIKSYG